MSDEQKLEALLIKAIKSDIDLKLTSLSIPDYVRLLLSGSPWLEQLFFGNHDFVRALFGEEFVESVAQYLPDTGESKNPSDVSDWYGKTHYDGPTYKYHLMMAVLLPTPYEQIDYFYRSVFSDA